GPNRSLSGNGITLDEFLARGDQTAEILRPRTILRGVEDQMSDLSRAQLLRLRREAEERIRLSVDEQPHRCVERFALYPLHVLARINTDVSEHAGLVEIFHTGP